MNTSIDIVKFLEMREEIPVIDVRSPAEYAHAHIPGAYSLPIFSNEERAEVGTCYKKEGRDKAILLGLRLVGPKLAYFAEEAIRLAKNNKIIVHCWRGGMRSSSMAWLFSTAGVETFTLEGGYKTYRRYVKESFAKNAHLVVLGGMTGSGKTEILKEIALLNQQVVDLEGLANHKGSAFGALGQKEQCSTEQFENNLFEEWKKLDLEKPIWIEDESKTIGKIGVPEELYFQMRKSGVINIVVPIDERIKWLVSEYGVFTAEELRQSIIRIQKRLGGNNTKVALEAIENEQLNEAACMVLVYYDKAYQYGLSQRNGQSISTLELQGINHAENAKEVLSFYNSLNS